MTDYKPKIAIVGLHGWSIPVLRRIFSGKTELHDSVAAVFDPNLDVEEVAQLIRHHPYFGSWNGHAEGDRSGLTIEGKKFPYIRCEMLGGGKLIDLCAPVVLDTIGCRMKRSDFGHLFSAGAKRVLVNRQLAPTEIDATIVRRINDSVIDGERALFSMGSYLLHAVTPIAKVLLDSFGVEYLSFTSHQAPAPFERSSGYPFSQHPDLQSGFSLSETSVGMGIGLAIPELNGKVIGNRLLCTSAKVTKVIIDCQLTKTASEEEVHETLRKAAEGPMRGLLAVFDQIGDGLGIEEDIAVETTWTKVISNHLRLICSVDPLSAYPAAICDTLSALLSQ